MSDARREMDGTALDAIGGDLLAAARRRATRRRRGRRTVIAIVVAVTTAVGTAGASSLAGFSTGVSQIDDLLDRNAALEQQAIDARAENIATLAGADKQGQRVFPSPRFPDTRPGAGTASDPVSVPWSDGTKGVGVAYVSRERGYCFAVAPPAARNRGRAFGSVGCAPPALASKRLAEQPAFIIRGGASAGRLVLQGFARADADSVVVETSAGPLAATLSNPWCRLLEQCLCAHSWPPGRLRVWSPTSSRTSWPLHAWLWCSTTAGHSRPPSLAGRGPSLACR